MLHSNGAIIWEGPSPFDGKPIVALLSGLTTPSANNKTGPMLQLAIIRADMDPVAAIKEDKDGSICGNCPHKELDSCFVAAFRSPRQKYVSFKNGQYWDARSERELQRLLAFIRIRRATIRFGEYGDPAMLPLQIVEALAKASSKWTGYTHQQREAFYNKDFDKFFMRSIETKEQAEEGVRHYRVSQYSAEELDKVIANKLPSEVLCPFYTHGVQCAQCGFCNGTSTKAKSVVAPVHGLGWKVKRYKKSYTELTTC